MGPPPPHEGGPELAVGGATREPFPGIGTLPNLVWVYGLMGAIWLCGLFTRFLPPGTTWIALAAVGAGVLVWVLLRVLPLAWTKWMAPIAKETLVDHAARVGVLVPSEHIAGTEERLARERGLCFDPELIRPVLGLSKGRAAVVPWIVISMVVVTLAVLFDARMPGRSIFPRSYFPNFFQFALAFAAGGIASDWLVPVYLVLTPGRLETRTHGLLGRGKARVTAYDLTSARVRVNERARTLSVLPPGTHWVSDLGPGAKGPGAGLGVSLRLTPGGLEFIRRVEAAALGAPAAEESSRRNGANAEA
ncbi:MAG: hypothetical protein IT439_06645 [Phycisphaerales bacterium]|nr:hypothetical protein [Phycisphaerales bacterium]